MNYDIKKLIIVLVSIILLTGCQSPVTGPSYDLDTDIDNDSKIDALVELGIIKGDQDGMRLDEPITRSETTAIILRALDVEDQVYQWEHKIFFPDIMPIIDHRWANGYINLATRLEVLQGYQDDTFRPDHPILQNEILTILLRTLNRTGDIATQEGVNWADGYIDRAVELDLLNSSEDINPEEPATREMVFGLLYDIMALNDFKYLELNELGYLEDPIDYTGKPTDVYESQDFENIISGKEFWLTKNIDGNSPKVVGSIGDMLYFQDKKSISRALDIDLETEELWTFENNIDGVHITDNDVLYVATSIDRWSKDSKGEVFRSDDFGQTFTKVLDLENGSAYGVNFDSYLDLVLISEYGIKEEGYNARNIYRSTDGGKSFDPVYIPDTEEGYHNHVIHIDRYNPDIVYQVVGDDNKRLLVSKDQSETYHTLWWGNYHPMAVLDRADYLLYGLDNVPYPGLIKLDKETLEVVEMPELEITKGPIYSMVDYRDKVYFGTISYANIHDHSVALLVSEDDLNTKKLFDIDKGLSKYPTKISNITPKGDFLYMYVNFGYRDEYGEGIYRGTLKYPIN